MKIAILLAGHTNKEMPAEFHDYNILFERAFAQSSLYDAFSFTSFAVVDDIFPDSIDEFDGFLITGSAYGVYDDVPFIAKLMDLVRQIHAARKPLAGICFGHQIIAHALGGHAQKWPHGWGLGIQQITLDDAPPWIETKEDTLNLIHMHQDQVIKLPKCER
ncbi:MAG: type 1 glutamine amidotransferase [Candidatus Puniceispirillum sp.]